MDSGNPYKWGNKEYDVFLGSYDFGARYYTPASTAIPRWTTMDPLCEKYYSISPYAYCAGNPVRFVDPNGMYYLTKNDERTADRLQRLVERRARRFGRLALWLSRYNINLSGKYATRAVELFKTSEDLQNMRAQKDIAFHFEDINRMTESDKAKYDITTSETKKTGTDSKGNQIITMFSEDGGTRIHEARHGGQIACGQSMDSSDIPREVSAFRAQFAWLGHYSYYSVSALQNNDRYVSMYKIYGKPFFTDEIKKTINFMSIVR